MSKTWHIELKDQTGDNLTISDAKIWDSAESPVFDLSELPDGIVVKDYVDGTTAWKIRIDKDGVLDTIAVSTE